MLRLITLNCDDGRKLYYSNGQRSAQGFHENVQDATLYPEAQHAGTDFGMLRSTLYGQALVRNALIRPTFKKISGNLAVEQLDMNVSQMSSEIRI
jgi:hypothetical protein